MTEKPTVGVISLGCSKNRVDTEQMLGLLGQKGFNITPDMDKAQVILINTCAFIQSAKEESIETILEVASRKKANPDLKIIVTGCLPQRYRQELSREMPEVDGWAGVGQYGRIDRIVEAVCSGNQPEAYEILDLPIRQRLLTTPRHLAYVRIAEGCDHRCTYCAIPNIRGRYKSRPMEEIVSECEWLAQRGIKEAVIIAQDTSYYGKDLYGVFRLPELLCRIAGTGIPWIRLMYAYPERINDALLDAMEEYPNVLPYLDMPIQHIDDTILRRMGRPFSQRAVEDLLEKIHSRGSTFALRTTLIAGFPGESEDQFQELLHFVEKGLFDHMGVFSYSQEDGTPAAAMTDQIPESVKKQRTDALMAAQRAVSRVKNAQRVNQTADVIVESVDANGCGVGRAWWQAPEVDGIIRIRNCRTQDTGKIVQCRILRSGAYDLEGEIAP